MVDIATPTVGSHARGSMKAHTPDDETFRVAEELMLLSASRSRGAAVSTNRNGGGVGSMGDMMHKKDPAHAEEPVHQRRGQKALTAQFELLMSPSSESSQTAQRAHQISPQKSPEDIINSRSDVSHSQLLKEHRSRFRRARRRWNVQRAHKQKAILANFKVQGVPLVQHLASLTIQWR